MSKKYKELLEREWKGKPLSEMKLKTLQLKTDKNLSDVLSGKYKRRLK
jgi:hypothetical protein